MKVFTASPGPNGSQFLLLSLILVVLSLGSCSDEEPVPDPPTPWIDHEILPGNFAINSADITMIEDFGEIDYYSDGTDLYSNYVRRTSLPTSDFEFYSIFIYVPTDLDYYTTTVSGAGARLYYYDENSTRISADNSSSFRETTTIGGVEHSVYEIVIRDRNFYGNARTFEKIVYAFNVSYEENESGLTVHAGTVNVDVYADTESQPDAGTITFWVDSDFGCGFIDVSLTGVGNGTISSFYGTNPGCDASGNANFDNLPFGSYRYTASSNSGCTWSGNIALDVTCYTLQLTL